MKLKYLKAKLNLFKSLIFKEDVLVINWMYIDKVNFLWPLLRIKQNYIKNLHGIQLIKVSILGRKFFLMYNIMLLEGMWKKYDHLLLL